MSNICNITRSAHSPCSLYDKKCTRDKKKCYSQKQLVTVALYYFGEGRSPIYLVSISYGLCSQKSTYVSNTEASRPSQKEN